MVRGSAPKLARYRYFLVRRSSRGLTRRSIGCAVATVPEESVLLSCYSSLLWTTPSCQGAVVSTASLRFIHPGVFLPPPSGVKAADLPPLLVTFSLPQLSESSCPGTRQPSRVRLPMLSSTSVADPGSAGNQLLMRGTASEGRETCGNKHRSFFRPCLPEPIEARLF